MLEQPRGRPPHVHITSNFIPYNCYSTHRNLKRHRIGDQADDSNEQKTMAPPNLGKRMKGVQIIRPFVYGTTARPFDPVKNPKPESVPADHTHSWTVFVKGVDDTDITYWVKKVQFKLHDSIPNPNRRVSSQWILLQHQ